MDILEQYFNVVLFVDCDDVGVVSHRLLQAELNVSEDVIEFGFVHVAEGFLLH